MKTNIGKDLEGYTKVVGRGKGGGRKHQNKPNENKLPSHNSFEILEEEGEENGRSKDLENISTEKGEEDSMDITQENNELKEDPLSTIGLGRDQEMTPSEGGIEDQDLQEILDRENLELE